MADDLTERLRRPKPIMGELDMFTIVNVADIREAADRIEELEAENEALKRGMAAVDASVAKRRTLVKVGKRKSRRIREQEAQVQRLADDIRTARFVATYWRDRCMETDTTRWGAHPLAMTLAALDGERDLSQLGVEQ